MRKKILLSNLVCLIFISVHAKDIVFNLSLNGQGLEKQLSNEQCTEVTHLILKDGKLNEADYAFIREGKLPNLRILDMAETSIDSIPNEAFAKWNIEYYQLDKLILPRTLVHLGDKALGFEGNTQSCVVEFTGDFPTCGHNILCRNEYGINPMVNITVSEDNTYCKLGSGGIYSADGSVFYLSFTNYINGDIADGTRSIAPHAFENATIWEITLPASVTTIGDYAFYNVQVPVPTGSNSDYDHGPYFKCRNSEVPQTGKESFGKNNEHEWDTPLINNSVLRVPQESVELYKEADGWRNFLNISPIITSSIKQNLQSTKTVITRQADEYIISFGKIVRSILLVDATGKQLTAKEVEGKQLTVKENELATPYVLLLISYDDNTKETVKLKK